MIFFQNVRFSLVVVKRRVTHGWFSTLFWLLRGGKMPAPNFVKQKFLRDLFLKDAVSIETGTFLGETTILLSKFSKKVISFEPEKALFTFATKRCERFKNIQILNAESNTKLGEILQELPTKSDVNFWLDGHFSGGFTYQGTLDTPIKLELQAIMMNLPKLNEVRIAIDDFREFLDGISNIYPSRSELINWAEMNGFTWDVQFDMFIMKRKKVSESGPKEEK